MRSTGNYKRPNWRLTEVAEVIQERGRNARSSAGLDRLLLGQRVSFAEHPLLLLGSVIAPG
jgi:hypothetical protein